MLRYIIPSIFFFFIGFSLFGQVPRSAVIQERSITSSESRSQMMCDDQNAGSRLFTKVDKDNPTQEYSVVPSILANVEILPEPIFLCFGDEFEVDHAAGSENLSGDFNTSTDAGIGYAFYNSQPTITGPTLNDILGDDIRTVSPDTPLVASGFSGARIGDIVFRNSDNFGNGITLQDSLNNGNPIQLWFAPITYDAKNETTERAIYEDGLNSCVNVNVDEAFSVVYLNPFDISFDPNTSSNNICQGSGISSSITITGGLPEFDNNSTQYIVTIENVNDPSIQGVIPNNATETHNMPFSFSVPVAGEYRVRVRDGKSCDGEFIITITSPTTTVNAIDTTSFDYPYLSNECQARLILEGGLPEMNNGEEYSISIIETTNPTITGKISSGTLEPNRSIVVEVPQAGNYEVIIEDSGSCSFSFPINFSNCSNDNLIFRTETQIIPKDSVTCVDAIIGNDYKNIASMFFIYKWDPNILEFSDVNFGKSRMEIEDFGQVNPDIINGTINYIFQEPSLQGTDLFEGDILFTVCFKGIDFGESQLEFTGFPEPTDPQIEILASDENLNITVVKETVENGSIRVVDPDQISLNLTIKNTIDACTGIANGGILVNPEGGEAPYTLKLEAEDGTITDYFISTPFVDTLITGLSIGSYTARLVDATDSEFDTKEVNIEEANLLLFTDAPKLPGCFGDSTGIVRVDVRDPSFSLTEPLPSELLTDYTFEWSNGQTSQVATDIYVGNNPSSLSKTYIVTVTDPNGCSDTEDVIVGQPMPLQFRNPQSDITKINATCTGSNDGSISIDLGAVEGGITTGNSYLYDWSNGDSGNNINNLNVGEYEVTVSDNEGCTLTRIINIEGGLELAINGDPINPGSVTCFGEEDGFIQVGQNQVANSVSPLDPDLFVFSWSNGDSQTGNSSRIENLPPDIYSVTMTHADAPSECFAVNEFEIKEPDSLIVDIVNVENTTTCISTDGLIEVNAIGGTQPFNYSWVFKGDNIDPGNSNIAPSLKVDSVTISVLDDNGCAASLDTVVGSPAPPNVLKFDDFSLLCAESDKGYLQIQAEPREGLITGYRWSHNNNVPDNFAGTLTPGTYTVTITDENECTTIDSAKVIAPPPIEFTNLDTLQEACFGEANGSLAVELMGGVTDVGYDLNWLDVNNEVVASNNLTLANAVAGTYTIKGMDANECEFETSVTLPSLPEIQIEVDPSRTQGTTCFDNGLNPKDGQAFIEVSYADDRTGTFDIFWPTQQDIGKTESLVENLGSGMIEVLVLESVGICSNSAIIEIPSPTEVMLNDLNTSFKDVTCNGGNDGTITVDAMGGTGPYTYAWDYEGSTATTLRDLPRGSYTVTITDNNNCIASDNFEIIEPAAMELLLDFDNNNTRNVVCFGDENGQITVIPTGGNTSAGGVSYSWVPNVANGPVATDLQPGINYTVTATDSEGCTADTSYTVQQPPPILWDIQPNEAIQCNGGATTLVPNELSFSGGNGGTYTYSVDSPLDDQGRPLDQIIQVRAGDHLISVFDSGGCRQDSTINIPEPEAISIEFPSAELDGRNLVTEVELGGAIELNPDIFSPLPIADLIWTSSNPADTAFLCNDPAFCDNPTVSPLENTTYSLSITDQNGCTADASLLVEVDKNRNVFIPNAFAPNAKGFDLNENFKIYSGVGVEFIEFARVFDRWGAMVASIDTPTLPSSSGIEVWDGKIQGQRAPQGVYIYIISITFVDGTNLLYRGDVTVLR